VQALAAGVFHFNRHTIASRVIDLQCRSTLQALAAKVFNLDHNTIERAPASKVVCLNRRHSASRIFHLSNLVIRHSLAPIASSTR